MSNGVVKRQNGTAIQEFRRRANLSVEQMTTLTGLAGSTIRCIETGHRQASPEALASIADALKLPVDAISTSVPEGVAQVHDELIRMAAAISSGQRCPACEAA
jgi:transcriptional regulator with XRE-family HTH domain